MNSQKKIRKLKSKLENKQKIDWFKLIDFILIYFKD